MKLRRIKIEENNVVYYLTYLLEYTRLLLVTVDPTKMMTRTSYYYLFHFFSSLVANSFYLSRSLYMYNIFYKNHSIQRAENKWSAEMVFCVQETNVPALWWPFEYIHFDMHYPIEVTNAVYIRDLAATAKK